MPLTQESKDKIAYLRGELELLLATHNRLGFIDHWIAVALMVLTLASSILAGFGRPLGLTADQIAAWALVPAAMALVASTLKFQGRSNWHFRKTEAVDGLLHRLLCELPEPPDASDIAKVSADLTKIKQDFLKEWAKEFAFSWVHFGRT